MVDRNRPVLIAFSGIDGSGKSTLIRALRSLPTLRHCTAYRKCYTSNVDHLLELHEGKLSRESYLQGSLAVALRWAFALDFIVDYRQNVKPLLVEGGIIMLDRWTPCAIAWGAVVKVGTAIREVMAALPKPDIIIHLDITPLEAYTRLRSTRVARLDEDPLILREFRKAYNQTLPLFTCPVHVVDSIGPFETVVKAVEPILTQFLSAG